MTVCFAPAARFAPPPPRVRFFSVIFSFVGDLQTKDNVFVTAVVSVQYQPIKEKVQQACMCRGVFSILKSFLFWVLSHFRYYYLFFYFFMSPFLVENDARGRCVCVCVFFYLAKQCDRSRSCAIVRLIRKAVYFLIISKQQSLLASAHGLC